MTTMTRSDGTRRRVLVVDDEENVAHLVSSALRFDGFETLTAHQAPHGAAPPEHKEHRPMPIWGWIVLAAVVLLVLLLIFTYNALVRLRNQVDEAWNQISVQLKRR